MLYLNSPDLYCMFISFIEPFFKDSYVTRVYDRITTINTLGKDT